MQGMGWLCLEELIWGDQQHRWVRPGQLLTRGPGTYKIPSANDIPLDFRRAGTAGWGFWMACGHLNMALSCVVSCRECTALHFPGRTHLSRPIKRGLNHCLTVTSLFSCRFWLADDSRQVANMRAPYSMIQRLLPHAFCHIGNRNASARFVLPAPAG